jgi:hypothetical protein
MMKVGHLFFFDLLKSEFSPLSHIVHKELFDLLKEVFCHRLLGFALIIESLFFFALLKRGLFHKRLKEGTKCTKDYEDGRRLILFRFAYFGSRRSRRFFFLLRSKGNSPLSHLVHKVFFRFAQNGFLIEKVGHFAKKD